MQQVNIQHTNRFNLKDLSQPKFKKPYLDFYSILNSNKNPADFLKYQFSFC